MSRERHIRQCNSSLNKLRMFTSFYLCSCCSFCPECFPNINMPNQSLSLDILNILLTLITHCIHLSSSQVGDFHEVETLFIICSIYHILMWTYPSLHFPNLPGRSMWFPRAKTHPAKLCFTVLVTTDHVITTAILLNCDMAFGTFLWRETIKLVSMLH